MSAKKEEEGGFNPLLLFLSHWPDSAARHTFVHRMTQSVIRHSSITRSSPKRHERLGGPFISSKSKGQMAQKKKKRAETLFLLFEPLAGLEPATHALRMRCSTNWATMARAFGNFACFPKKKHNTARDWKWYKITNAGAKVLLFLEICKYFW